MLTIHSYEEFEQHLGQELGKSDWLQVDQERINLFADATLDHQWIHVDPERAKEGPFGQTIVHGYLTLSLLPYLWEQVIKVENIKMLVNYGMDKPCSPDRAYASSPNSTTSVTSEASARWRLSSTLKSKTKRNRHSPASPPSSITSTEPPRAAKANANAPS